MKKDPRIVSMEGMLEHCVNFNFRRLARLVGSHYDREFAHLGIKTTQYSLLSAIYYAKQPALGELAQGLALERTTLLRNLGPLEERKLVESVPGGRGQSRRVQLTPSGRKLLGAAFKNWKKAQAGILKEIGFSRWSNLSRELKDLAHGLQAGSAQAKSE